MDAFLHDWVYVFASPAGPHGRSRHELAQVALHPRRAGLAVLGAGASLERERARLLAGKPVSGDVVFNAAVWDHDRHLQWQGDLDVRARAIELQHVADLIHSPVSVTQRFVRPLRNGAFQRLKRDRVVCTFHPREGRAFPLARLSMLDVRDRIGGAGSPVWWAPFGRDREAACFMDFSSSARLAMATRTSSVPEPADPELMAAARVLCRAIVATVVRYGMGDLAVQTRLPLLEAYVQRALALVANDICQIASSDR